MTSKEIYKALRSHYANQKYILTNNFIFNWESDFFCMSDSGYFTEIEVKVSKSDFKRDFCKEKHKIFEAIWKKKDHYIHSQSNCRGDLLCKYIDHKVSFNGGRWADNHPFYTIKIRKSPEKVYAPATRIRVIKLADLKIPNRFYFCVPEGMNVQVPDYAGLLTVNEFGVKVVKQAPFLHKDILNLWKRMCEIYYWKDVNREKAISLL